MVLHPAPWTKIQNRVRPATDPADGIGQWTPIPRLVKEQDAHRKRCRRQGYFVLVLQQDIKVESLGGPTLVERCIHPIPVDDLVKERGKTHPSYPPLRDVAVLSKPPRDDEESMTSAMELLDPLPGTR